MGPMTRVVGPMLVLLLVTGCGGAPEPDAGALCFRHEAEPETSHRGFPDYVQVYEVVLFPDGRYGAFESIPPGTMLEGPSYEGGRWAAKDGKITFVPDIWTGAWMGRRYEWTDYVPGTSLAWMPDPPTEEPEEGAPPPVTVLLEVVPPGDLPERARREEARQWRDFLPIHRGSPFEYEDEDAR